MSVLKINWTFSRDKTSVWGGLEEKNHTGKRRQKERKGQYENLTAAFHGWSTHQSEAHILCQSLFLSWEERIISIKNDEP